MNHHNYQESSASDANLPPDSRYPHNHSVMATSTYGYQQYPSHSYDNQSTQYQHTPLPPIRSSSSQAQASQASSHHQPPSSYQANYAPSHYSVTPASHQWPEEPWSNAPHVQPFSPSQPASAFDSARSETAPSPRVDSRAYPPSYHTPAEGGRQSQGHHSQSPDDDTQPLSRGKERERETSTERYSYPQTDSRHELVDYKDLLFQCRDLLSQSTFMENNTDTVDSDYLDRMHQNASRLLRTLSAGNPFPVAPRPNADDVIAESRTTEQADQPPKKHKPDLNPSDSQKCLGCGATSTPEWRRGPLGPRTLCNACGLVYAKMIKKRSREIGAQPLSTTTTVSQPPPSNPPPPIHEEETFLSTAEGGTDDEQSQSYDTDR